MAYRTEVEKVSFWCSANNLILKVHKAKELIMNFRKNRQAPSTKHPPLIRERAETVTTVKYLGTHISGNQLLLAFNHSSVESVLAYCLGV